MGLGRKWSRSLVGMRMESLLPHFFFWSDRSSPPPASICKFCWVFQKQSCATPLYFFSWALRCSTRNRRLVEPFLTKTHTAMPSTSDGTPSRVSDTSRPGDASAVGGRRAQTSTPYQSKWLLSWGNSLVDHSGWILTCCRAGWTAVRRHVICQTDKRKEKTQSTNNCGLKRQSSKCI